MGFVISETRQCKAKQSGFQTKITDIFIVIKENDVRINNFPVTTVDCWKGVKDVYI